MRQSPKGTQDGLQSSPRSLTTLLVPNCSNLAAPAPNLDSNTMLRAHAGCLSTTIALPYRNNRAAPTPNLVSNAALGEHEGSLVSTMALPTAHLLQAPESKQDHSEPEVLDQLSQSSATLSYEVSSVMRLTKPYP